MLPVSPHNHSFDFSKMHFSYTPLSADWIIDTKSLSIDIRYDKEADENTKNWITILKY